MYVCVCVCVCVAKACYLYGVVCYAASGYSFERVLYYGNEWSLFQLELLVFAVVDLVAGSFVLATILALLVSWVRAC